jgi:DNA-binding SARP family transcriptional activator
MTAEMEFCLLGPLEVRWRGQAVAIRGGKQRALLAALLLRAGHVVSLDELAEVLWAAEPPPSARVTVQNYVKRLRQELARAGAAGKDRITTRSPGYVLRAAADEVDVTRFEASLESALRNARGEAWQAAADEAEAALELWRGQPLAGIESELLEQRELPRLEGLGLRAIETKIDAYLRLGRHAEVIAELERLAGTHPLREHSQALLMLALYRDGRQAEALATYRATRRTLIDQLGSEPGQELRDLHQRILAADPALDASAAAVGVARAREVPRQLPAPVRHFVGRDAELAALTGLLGPVADGLAGTLVISAIGGTAGVGKTALAVQWAHQVAARFPDGQLYVNLRGYDTGEPMPTGEALAAFLRALGLASAEIPADVDERASVYRSLLAGKRVLILLDNARTAGQVRPLLPASSSCAAIVTSRDRLAGLVARDGAERLELDLLAEDEAVVLLRELIGARIDAEPAAALRLVNQCCRLPLALRVAAELAISRPDDSLAELVTDLADLRRRLDLLEAGGDSATAIRAVFSWSYGHLDPAAARAFALAGRHPGADFDRYALAALAGRTLDEAGRVLDALSRAHLIQATEGGRYAMHDLLAAYARERGGGQPGDEALTRLFTYYLYTAARAMDNLMPTEAGRRPRVADPGCPVPAFADEKPARDWLDAERANLVMVSVRAAEHGVPGHAIAMSATLFRYLDTGGHFGDAVIIHGRAVAAAADTGDLAARAHALISLGTVGLQQGRHDEAQPRFAAALTLCRAAADPFGQARALINLAIIELYQGRYEAAAASFAEVVEVSRASLLRPQEIRGLTGLGTAALYRGRYRQAADQLQQAADLCELTGDRTYLVETLVSLGDANCRLGRYARARACLARARAVSQETGDRLGDIHSIGFTGITALAEGEHAEAASLLAEAVAASQESGHRTAEGHLIGYLGLAEAELGEYQQAAAHLNQALALGQGIGDRSGQAAAFNGLGEVWLATGDPDRSVAEHEQALAVAEQINDADQRARAHAGLGAARAASGDAAAARAHWLAALSIYTELESPVAGQVRARLEASR